MMTTDVSEKARDSPVWDTRVLRGAAASTMVSGTVLAGVGALLDGLPAALGSLVGAMIITTVMSLGVFPMTLVAGVMPRLSLAFALLTYFFQLMALIASLVALDRAGLVGDELARGWLGAALLVGVASWVVAHVTLAARARIPIYRLAADPLPGARDADPEPRTDPGAR